MDDHQVTDGDAPQPNGGVSTRSNASAGGTPGPVGDASRRLSASIQRRDDLIALLAAELRGPTTALLRHVGRLRQGEAGPRPRSGRRALDALERQARRLVSLTERLAVLSGLESGRVPIEPRPVELSALLARAADSREGAAARRGVAIVRALPVFEVTVPADAARIEEAVAALLDASIAATPRGGRVRLALDPSPSGARILVEDGGPSARQARRAVLRGVAGQGLGLGLAVCRTVAELHGGGFQVSPRARGRCAELTLPASLPAPAPEAPVRLGAPRARVLVADDDPDARDALALMLSDDYDVVLAADGHEAVDHVVASRPDVVLMDLYMPRMDGLTALEILRQDPATGDVPVILISARGDEAVRSRSLDLGAVDFLQKPFSGRELKARIERTLRLTRRETQLQALARTDPLTGLPNVRAFRARLEEEVKRARRYRTPLACVMVDMDHLKPINDALGHGAGDAAIAAVAEVLRQELRETDFGARYGGDEFVMLLPHTSALEARVFAERVCARLRESSVDVRGHALPLQASFGVAALGDGPLAEAGETTVLRADAALYAAKRAGRGCVVAHPALEPARDGDDVAPAPA